MRPISSLSHLTLGLFSSWQMLLFLGAVYLLIAGFRDRRRIAPPLRNALLLLLCFINYTLFQCTVGYTSQNAVTPFMIRIVAKYAKLPALLLLSLCTLLTIVEVLLIRSMRQWYNTHITSASIKETIETLPVGICAFEPNGRITLRNKTMEQLCRSLINLPLLNGNEFVLALRKRRSDFTDFAVSLPDGSVWSFTEDELESSSAHYTLLIAYNVTEAYQKTQMLAKRQATVQELNRKLLAYNREIEQVITQQEILNAKIHIHDELGTGLLAIKHYLVSGGSEQELKELLTRLQGNIRFLQKEAVSETRDEYALILSTARDLGVSVAIDGTLPETEPNRHILATAIHECFTNILRHTNGDTLSVRIREDERTVTAHFTDNNTLPFEGITETGGLRSLRDLTEQAGGRFEIAVSPRYHLTITLVKEVETDALSSFDRR